MAPRRTSLLLLLLYSLSFLCISLWLSAHVSRTIPQPYMDEEFHVGQTQTYCAGRWTEWHPKITTLPGLYVTAVPYAQALGALSQQHLPSPSSTNNSTENAAAAIQLCSVAVLRSLNVVYAVLCIPLYFALLRMLHPSLSPFRSLLATVQLSVFPLCYFFAFLFYTDLASVFWTLTAYLSLLRGHRFLAAVLSACAVFVRQTNVAWVGFMLLTEIVHAWQRGDATLFGDKHARTVAASAELRKQLASGGRAPFQAHDGEKEGKIALESLRRYHAPTWADVPRTLVSLVVDCLRALPYLLVRYLGLLLVLASFVLFVRWNGGIVVGDRDNHLFHPHWPQMLYFLAFTAGFTALNWISLSNIRDVAGHITRYPLASVAVAGMMAAAVHFFTSV
jgi:alpha-1,2-glucosyltransferase